MHAAGPLCGPVLHSFQDVPALQHRCSRPHWVTYLLCLEAMLKLKPQLVWLVLHQACGPEAWSGLHAECGITWPLSHGVKVWILHGRIATLGYLCLRRVLLWENRGLLLQHDVGILA